MQKIKKNLLPLFIVILTITVVFVILENKPDAKRKAPSKISKVTVETMSVKSKPYTIFIESYGKVNAQIQSSLTSQVSGKIVFVNKSFRDGGFFKKDDILLKIENSDYEADVKIAQAELTLAKQALLEEEARVKQAKENWMRFGNNEVANKLVLRTPQLESSKAVVQAAQAKLLKTKLSLSRTNIKAPYNGRILKKNVDIGQVISTNSLLANIYSTDIIDVRLPIRNSELSLINLPNELSNDFTSKIPVTLSSNLIGEQKWEAVLTRTEAAIDSSSQQLYVIAQILNPYDKTNQQKSIKIGQYLTATIQGKKIKDALIIPNSSIYQGSYIYIEKDGFIHRRYIKILWQNNLNTIVSSGLENNENIVLTQLGVIGSGTEVKVMNKKKENKGSNK